jgi:hypothetical protein
MVDTIERSCAACGTPYKVREWVGVRQVWGIHTIPIRGPKGEQLLYWVPICMTCRDGKTPEELDAIAERDLLARCAPRQ